MDSVYHCQVIALLFFHQLCWCQKRVCSRHKFIVALMTRSSRFIMCRFASTKCALISRVLPICYLPWLVSCQRIILNTCWLSSAIRTTFLVNVAGSIFVLELVFLPIMIVSGK